MLFLGRKAFFRPDMIYIILPIHNRRRTTLRFLQYLKLQTRKDFHLLLIDDGSTDGSTDVVRNEIENATILKGNGHLWWAGSLQKAINWARDNKVHDFDTMVIMNNDTIFTPDFLETGVRLLQSTDRTLITAQCYSQQSGRLIDPGIHFDWAGFGFTPASTSLDINCLSTRGLFIRYGDIAKIGKFHPVLLPHYLSDYEYTMRALRRGFLLATYPTLKLWVDESTTGIHSASTDSAAKCFYRQFSLRSSANLMSWMIFILFACPAEWRLLNWYRVILRALKELWACVIS